MKSFNEDNEIKMPEIKSIFHKKILFNKMIHKIKLKPIDYTSTTGINVGNQISTFTELDKSKIKISKAILLNKQKNNEFNYHRNENLKKDLNRYINNSLDIKKDLKRYTNNSLAFRLFKESNTPYHAYEVNKAKRSILLQIKNNNNLENKIVPINSIKSIIKSNLKNITNINISRNNFFIKRNKTINLNEKSKDSKIFRNIKPINIKFSFLDDQTKKDIEQRDVVDFKIFENEKLKKSIKESLLNDINHDELQYKLYLDFKKSITNRVNYFEDIFIIPHIKNNFSLSKPFDDLIALNEKLRNRNLLHRQVALSMNKICIIKKLLKIKKKMEMQKLLEEYEPKNELIPNINNELKQFEEQFGQFELNDYFDKSYNNAYIWFANKKLKDTIYKKVNPFLPLN